MSSFEVIVGDALEVLRGMPSESVHTCVTSPPYFGLRDYGTGQWGGGDAGCDHRRAADPNAIATSGLLGSKRNVGNALAGYGAICGKCGAKRIDNQIGLEASPEAFVAALVEVFREVRRVLRKDGTCWVNLGDSYAGSWGNYGSREGRQRLSSTEHFDRPAWDGQQGRRPAGSLPQEGLKPKDLIGIPWAVAEALRDPYYAGRIKRERDRVWLAAMIDAEGTICGSTHIRKDTGATRTHVNVAITNSNRAILDEAQRIWPSTRSDHNPHSDGHLGGFPTWRWIAHDVDEKALLMRELYPYMIGKKVQAMLAWNFFELSRQAKRLARTPEAQQVTEKRAWIMAALSDLNHYRSIDIPKWIQEPPSLYEPGYYLRSDCIWHKPNPMPESVTDRPTKAHEYIFLLTKAERYYYDADAIREAHGKVSPINMPYDRQVANNGKGGDTVARHTLHPDAANPAGRNKRTVWTVATAPFSEAHFATFPPKLIEPCILSGTSERGCCAECGAPWVRVVERSSVVAVPRGSVPSSFRANLEGPQQAGITSSSVTKGWKPTCRHSAGVVPCTVLDPFCGAGTTGLVAVQHGRRFVGVELNSEYAEMARRRIHNHGAPLFSWAASNSQELTA